MTAGGAQDTTARRENGMADLWMNRLAGWMNPIKNVDFVAGVDLQVKDPGGLNSVRAEKTGLKDVAVGGGSWTARDKRQRGMVEEGLGSKGPVPAGQMPYYWRKIRVVVVDERRLCREVESKRQE